MELIDLQNDIYYSKEYASLYLKPGESLFSFDYQEGLEKFSNISIKRPIVKIGNVGIGDGYFDLETAYGYGGFYTNTDNKDFLCRAFASYKKKCLDDNIIAEFIRFHPYNKMPSLHGSHLDFVAADRETVSIDLTLSKDERWARYSSTTRNILRRYGDILSLKETTDLDDFMLLYQSTMDKNKADSFYYFKREYFERLLDIENVKLFSIIYENHIVSMAFVLLGQDLAHYHLSTNSKDFLKLNGNYYLLDGICDYLKKNYSFISDFCLGGGRTNKTDDNLLAFKSKFSHLRKQFYIAGMIINRPIYQMYVDMLHDLYPQSVNENYFLKYRNSAYE